MPTYLHPGVYLEEVPSGARPIEAVGTSTAAFLGSTLRGPVGEPVRITKWSEYVDRFGGVRDTGEADKGDPMGHSLSAFFGNGGGATFIVRVVEDGTGAESRAFFEHPDNQDKLFRVEAADPGSWGDELRVTMSEPEAGSGSFVLRVGFEVEDPDELDEVEAFSGVSADPDDPDYLVTRVNEASRLIRISVEQAADYQLGVSISGASLAGLDVTQLNGKSMTVKVDRENPAGLDPRSVSFANDAFDGSSDLTDVAAEIQSQVRGQLSDDDRKGARDLTAEVENDRIVLTSGTREPTSRVLVESAANDDAAALLEMGDVENEERTGAETLSALLVDALSRPVDLEQGADPGDPKTDDYKAALARLEKQREVSVVALPGRYWTADPQLADFKSTVDAARSHCEKTASRVLIVDPPPDTELTTSKQVTDLGLPTSTYTALYYPWVEVANPFYDAEKNPAVPVTVEVPPCGFAAGMWAKTDGRRGVWKAPAGVETSLAGAAGLTYQVEDAEQDVLNPLGVNCFRTLPGFGSVIWGARTLATKADPEWRYVPVRRTAIYLEQSIYNGIQWAVFEPNNHVLWGALRGNIEAFMDIQFKAGAFQGEKASDAYFVRCGLGSTMTQDHIDAGQVIVEVGFAPLKPAEFVIIRIQQKVNQQ